MSYNEVTTAHARYNIGTGDMVIYNGGEPTLFAGLADLVKFTKKLGAQSYLFSNGRRFSDKDFARKVVESGVTKIAIPVYTSDPDKHCFITQSPGSYRETIKGIENLISLRNKYRTFEIELKTLVCSLNIASLTECVDWALRNFPGIDYFLLSSAYIPSPKQFPPNDYFVSLKDSASIVRECIDIIKSHGIKCCLYYLPFCIIEKPEYFDLCDRNDYPSDRHSDYYFDPLVPHGIKTVPENNKPSQCSSCMFNAKCDGVWESYLEFAGSDELQPILKSG